MSATNNNYNLQNLDSKLFKSVTDYLTELQTIRIKGKPVKNNDGSTTVEFNSKLFVYDDMVFQVSGFLTQSKNSEKCVYFFSLIDQKKHNTVIKFSQKQHKSIVNIIKNKITL